MRPPDPSFTCRVSFDQDQPMPAREILAAKTGLPREKIVEALTKGAVWLTRRNRKNRIRTGSVLLRRGDILELNYDLHVLSLVPPQPLLIADRRDYTVWFKPAGLLAQGSPFGDHCSLLRLAEMHFKGKRQVFLVHRLDREAAGLMLIAHEGKAAAKLSELFKDNKVVKEYRVEVLGNLLAKGKSGRIDLPLDGKQTITEYIVEAYDKASNVSTVTVSIQTGRTHQIRRHFEMIGHPVMGDPKYGKGNKNREGMKLTATSLKFHCPFTHRDMQFSA